MKDLDKFHPIDNHHLFGRWAYTIQNYNVRCSNSHYRWHKQAYKLDRNMQILHRILYFLRIPKPVHVYIQSLQLDLVLSL
jgi:hypothetical protein